jgi:hypothetical protein
MSVTIHGYQVKKNKRGEEFVVLNLMSEPVMERSTNTGNFFANIYKANIVASFGADTAKLMIGKELPGTIIKKECDPYTYTVKATGKEIIMTYSYQYVDSGNDVYNNTDAPTDEIEGNPLV